jgi:hypothetical protein
MAVHRLKPENPPSSITTSGPVTFFQPTADPVVKDADGNVKAPGSDALEEQRKQFADAEKTPEEQEKASEQADIQAAASETAAVKNVSVKEAKAQITKAREEDKKAVAEQKKPAPAVFGETK